MGFNISKSFLDVCDAIHVDIDPMKLGKNQRAALLRVLASGVTYQNSVPHALARKMRKNHDLPRVHLNGWGGVYWHDVPKDSNMFDLLQSELTAQLLEETNTYRIATIRKSLDALGPRMPNGNCWGINFTAEERKQDFAKTITGLGDFLFPVNLHEIITIDITPERDQTFSSI